MAKTKISEYDATAANNTDINSINIAEGCAPSGINNAIRETMAALKRFQTGADGDPLTVGGNLVVSGSATLTTTSISSADINAGTIDGTTIGGSTPAAGTFTTLASTGNTTLGDASGDSVTINAATVSTPNGLNFDSNTLVIDAANNYVGIGTSSPVYNLDVSAASDTGFGIRNSSSVTSGNRGTISWLNSSASGVAYIRAGAVTDNVGTDLQFAVRPAAGSLTEAMRIDSSGNLLVGRTFQSGTANRAAVFSANKFGLSIIDTTAQAAGVGGALNLGGNYRSTGDAQAFCRVAAAKENSTDNNFAYAMTFATTPNGGTFTERLRIDSSGNVGIGTSSPGQKLDVSGGSVQIGNNVSYRVKDTAGNSIRAVIMGSDNILYSGCFDTPTSGGSYALMANGSERMRIDSSGNVGIGTSSPNRLLDIATSNAGGSTLVSLVSATDGNCQLLFGDTASDTQGKVLYNNSGDYMAFNTADTERMRIDSSGNLLVNTTTAGGKLTVYGTSGYISQLYSVSNAADYMQFTNGTVVGSITRVGGSNVAYNTSSDYRLKENIAPMTGALATVAQLKPCNWTWKVDGSAGQGFIAHELQAVVPDCVSGEKDAVDAEGKPVYQGVDTSFLVATLTAAIQELKAENDALKSRLDAAGL